MTIKIPTIFAAAALLATAYVGTASCMAAESAARHYAVLSLIGDNISVVFERGTTGSHLDQNNLQKIPIPNAELDSAALLAMDSLIQEQQPSVKKELLISNDAGLYRLQDDFFRGNAAADVVLGGLKEALKSKPAATHLILITKHRGDARLKLSEDTIGHGKLEGVGFYIDNRTWVQRDDTNEIGLGLIAPYAFITIRLIDTATWTVVNQKTLDSSSAYANVGEENQSLNAWGALSPEQKTAALKDIIHTAVSQAGKNILTAQRR